MRLRLIVATGRDDEDRRRADATTEIAQQIERRIVGPVEILEQQQRGSSGGGREIPQQGFESRKRTRGTYGEAPAALARDVPKWAERLRGGEVFAAAEMDLGVAGVAFREAQSECRLADARLAFDGEHPTATLARAGKGGFEPRERLGAFQERGFSGHAAVKNRSIAFAPAAQPSGRLLPFGLAVSGAALSASSSSMTSILPT